MCAHELPDVYTLALGPLRPCYNYYQYYVAIATTNLKHKGYITCNPTCKIEIAVDISQLKSRVDFRRFLGFPEIPLYLKMSIKLQIILKQ